jgi:hypothetical protein
VDPALVDTAGTGVEMGELTNCLNCGALLHGTFCAACGQRVVPPNPTVRELAGDAWHELSGYDGRIMRTIRGLARPGFLTREYLEGRRAHYLPPLRVYLILSVMFFVVAASVPTLNGRADGPGGLRIDLTNDDGTQMSDEERAQMRAELDDAAWFLRPMLRLMLEDPEGFRQRAFTVMPRVFFVMLPVFAAIVSLFYRGRTFPTALVFAVHLHAFAFIAFTVSEAVKFTGREHLAERLGAVIAVAFGIYALKSFRAVFGGDWPITLAKAVGVGFVYLVSSLPAFAVILVWASWT